MMPIINQRSQAYLRVIAMGINTNVELAKHFGVVTSGSNAIVGRMVKQGIVRMVKKASEEGCRPENHFFITKKKYTVSNAPSDNRIYHKPKEAATIEEVRVDAFDFYIYPFADAPEVLAFNKEQEALEERAPHPWQELIDDIEENFESVTRNIAVDMGISKTDAELYYHEYLNDLRTHHIINEELTNCDVLRFSGKGVTKNGMRSASNG